MNDLPLNKAAMRAQQREFLQALPSTEFTKAGLVVTRHLDSWLSHNLALLRKKKVALFRSMRDEIDTKELSELLLRLNIKICYPEVDENGSMRFFMKGLLEPLAISLAEIDIVFVPGRAFDLRGHRLGRGHGHYDRALASTQNGPYPLFIGLALDNQIVPRVPSEPHDVIMHYVCTPALGVLKTKGE
jgi:5,10-methenyltetrahydrofolate synthetase